MDHEKQQLLIKIEIQVAPPAVRWIAHVILNPLLG